jgi:hypothetical protein
MAHIYHIEMDISNDYQDFSVSDPDSLIPDQAFWVDPELKVLMTKKKNLQLEFFFISKIAIYLSLGLNIGRPSHRRSL